MQICATLKGFSIACALTLSTVFAWSAQPPKTGDSSEPTVIVVAGAPGDDEFGADFQHAVSQWEAACKSSGAPEITVGLDKEGQQADLDRLKELLTKQPKESAAELWLILVGHGTFDGKEAKFNLRGPDLTATNAAALLHDFKRPLVVVNCASASSPFLSSLSAPGRVIITSTRSGYEQNYARFGKFFADSICDPAADLDKDGQTSLLEAYLTASRRVADFYQSEGRLATEHPLLDDNGDGRGTPPDWFQGIRAVKKASDGASSDGLRAHQIHLVRSAQERSLTDSARRRRDELELALANLRELKKNVPADEYYRQLEPLLLELAQIYHKAETKSE